MKRFIFDLSDENRARLEGHRAAWGLRSLSAALQHLIATKADVPFSDAERHRIMLEIGERARREGLVPGAAVEVSAAELKAISRPGPGLAAYTAPVEKAPFKSRLKGEWKAP